MLSTLLGQVTKAFDRRAVVTAFAPSFVFWSIAAAAVALVELGWRGSFDGWRAQGATAQTVIVAGFLAWVAFWTFLTLNFRTTLVRLFEGYWRDSGLSGAAAAWARRRWQRRFDEADELDRKLEEQELSLEPAGAGERDRERERRLDDCRARRLRLHRELFLMYPSGRADVMPTRLGNVLRAAEVYSRDRYALDTPLLWTRLEASVFAEGAPEALQDAKASLDFMVTLSAFAASFGVALAFWLGLAGDYAVVWWAQLLVAVAALALRGWLAAAAAAVGLSTAVADALSAGADPGLGSASVAGFVAAVSFFLSAVAYRSAVEAAAAYGEKIKATIDVHRFALLEALNLTPPADLESERKLWEEVGGLIYRSYAPDPAVYRYARKAG